MRRFSISFSVISLNLKGVCLLSFSSLCSCCYQLWSAETSRVFIVVNVCTVILETFIPLVNPYFIHWIGKRNVQGLQNIAAHPSIFVGKFNKNYLNNFFYQINRRSYQNIRKHPVLLSMYSYLNEKFMSVIMWVKVIFSLLDEIFTLLCLKESLSLHLWCFVLLEHNQYTLCTLNNGSQYLICRGNNHCLIWRREPLYMLFRFRWMWWWIGI